jgi:cell division septal protein FtsQ
MRRIPDIQKTVPKKQSSALFSKKQERHFVRGVVHTSEQQERNYVSRTHMWQVMFLWLLFFLVAGYQVFFSGMLMIERVTIEGAGLLTSGEVEQTVQEALSEHIWTVFPQNNFLVLSMLRVEERLLASSPLIRQVSVKKLFPSTVIVSLLERGNFLFWCSGEESCFLIDEEGVLQDWPKAQEEHRVAHIFLDDEAKKPAKVGDRVVTRQFLLFINGLSQAFTEQSGITIRERMFVLSRYTDELRLETNEGFSLQINTGIPIERTLNTLRIVREKAIPEERRADLISVDLRIPGKAFYQLRNEVPQETEISPDDGTDLDEN